MRLLQIITMKRNPFIVSAVHVCFAATHSASVFSSVSIRSSATENWCTTATIHIMTLFVCVCVRVVLFFLFSIKTLFKRIPKSVSIVWVCIYFFKFSWTWFCICFLFFVAIQTLLSGYSANNLLRKLFLYAVTVESVARFACVYTLMFLSFFIIFVLCLCFIFLGVTFCRILSHLVDRFLHSDLFLVTFFVITFCCQRGMPLFLWAHSGLSLATFFFFTRSPSSCFSSFSYLSFLALVFAYLCCNGCFPIHTHTHICIFALVISFCVRLCTFFCHLISWLTPPAARWPTLLSLATDSLSAFFFLVFLSMIYLSVCSNRLFDLFGFQKHRISTWCLFLSRQVLQEFFRSKRATRHDHKWLGSLYVSSTPFSSLITSNWTLQYGEMIFERKRQCVCQSCEMRLFRVAAVGTRGEEEGDGIFWNVGLVVKIFRGSHSRLIIRRLLPECRRQHLSARVLAKLDNKDTNSDCRLFSCLECRIRSLNLRVCVCVCVLVSEHHEANFGKSGADYHLVCVPGHCTRLCVCFDK